MSSSFGFVYVSIAKFKKVKYTITKKNMCINIFAIALSSVASLIFLSLALALLILTSVLSAPTVCPDVLTHSL